MENTKRNLYNGKLGLILMQMKCSLTNIKSSWSTGGSSIVRWHGIVDHIRCRRCECNLLCIKQILNLVFENSALFSGVTRSSRVEFTLGINLVIWRERIRRRSRV